MGINRIAKVPIDKLLTLALRGLGIGGRFLLTFYLTKRISLEFQGEYTLMVTSVALLVIVFGFDFYVFSNRKVIKGEKAPLFYFKNALVFYILSYLILAPVLYSLLNWSGLIGKIPFLLCYGLIIAEHLGQELFRFYIAFRKPVLANLLLFFRTGLWPLLIVLYFFSGGTYLTINSILVLWLISAVLTLILGFFCFPQISQFFKTPISTKLIKKGILVGLTMFMSTICLKIMEFSDKYIITFVLDKQQLGIYSVYFQLANLINVVIFTMYVSFIYPDIIQGFYNKDVNMVTKGMKTIRNKSLLLIFFYGICSFIFIPIFIDFLDKPEMLEYIYCFYVFIVGTVFLNMGFSYHYLLVGANLEKMILKATIIACIINVCLNFVLIPSIGIIGASIAYLLGNFVMYILKRKFASPQIEL